PDELLKAVREAIVPQVFVVHGQDEDAKTAVVLFLEKSKLRPIVLRDQPSEGRTIIEKFEEYSSVSFAIILLTPDDVGARRGKALKLQPRARQNVIFELGFFVGALGRKRVSVLSRQEKKSIEIPSDYEGVQYISMDTSERWHQELAREIRQAGIKLDTSWRTY
ncbi:MAG TPA: nucleotide-binding protein, partial [Thermoanaerobaculia bacterium]